MTKKPLALLAFVLALLPTVSFTGEVPIRPNVVRQIARRYHEWRKQVHDPTYKDESYPYFEFPALDASVLQLKVTYDEYVAASRLLTKELGYKFPEPFDFGPDDFEVQLQNRSYWETQKADLIHRYGSDWKREYAKQQAVNVYGGIWQLGMRTDPVYVSNVFRSTFSNAVHEYVQNLPSDARYRLSREDWDDIRHRVGIAYGFLPAAGSPTEKELEELLAREIRNQPPSPTNPTGQDSSASVSNDASSYRNVMHELADLQTRLETLARRRSSQASGVRWITQTFEDLPGAQTEFERLRARMAGLEKTASGLESKIDPQFRIRQERAEDSLVRLGRSGGRTILPDGISLASQFGARPRDQGQAGTCSFFAATALLEAALFRMSSGHPDLSEMWLIRRGIERGLACSPGAFGAALLTPQDVAHVLDFVRVEGIPEESIYPYRLANQIDEFLRIPIDYGKPGALTQAIRFMHRPDAEKAPVQDKARQLFVRVFGDRGDSEIRKAFATAIAGAGRFKDMMAGRLYENTDPGDIIWLLDHGIPISIGLFGRKDRSARLIPETGAGHALVVSGFDRRHRTFEIRNSWGTYGDRYFGRTLPFQLFEKVKGEDLSKLDGLDALRSLMLQGKNVMDIEFVLCPDDRPRVCADVEISPPEVGRQLASFCAGQG